MKKQIILTIVILSLMNGCVMKRIMGGGKGHSGNHTSPIARPR